MTTMIAEKIVRSPINVDERKNLGLRPGDTVRVWQKIPEKGKVRLQQFEGLVLTRKHGSEAGATFTVRRTSSGVGVEKTFPLYSPMIDKIEIVKRTKVRRAKLYYIREKVAKEIRRAMRNAQTLGLSTESDIAAKDRIAKEAEEEATRAEEAAKQAEEAEQEKRAAEESKEEEVSAETETPADTPSEEPTESEEKKAE